MSAAPSLILSLEGERAERFGGCTEQVFDCRDGSIGRSDECDWVLAAEGVSRLHALVRYLNGLYFIEDRSTNGMLLNGTPLRKGDPAALKHGDRLQIDTFEIGARLSGETATQRAGAADRGRAVLEPYPCATAGDADQPKGLIPGAVDASMQSASLDPLAMFDAPLSYFDDAPLASQAEQAWNHTPAESDRFRAPRVEAVRASGPVLPDDWDATGSHVAPRAEPQSDSAPPGPAASVSAVAVSSAVAQPGPPARDPAADTPAHPAVVDLPAFTAEPVSASVPSSPWAPTAAPGASPGPSADRTSTDIDEMFHIAVDAMMDVLRARAELKNSFRLPATLIQRSENNPLKFAPTVQEAVRKLFEPPDSGFLSGSAALNDAAEDIRNHQLAMLAGVRSAFQSLLAHFDPTRIERELERNVRRLPLGSRPRHWDRYKEQFDALTRNPDECFQRLFGDEFARAYEQQLARLKSRHCGVS
ncbi:type VI secretion system-associated FHA domain protein TagH [Paraburkholderia caffeinilytica]|uniref:type VI secretion system-associated FHA domain protein TagH n=1 Tax=Paraburkholderia caffeinilytica TaxID=1761016 RepID=UPI0038BE175D